MKVLPQWTTVEAPEATSTPAPTPTQAVAHSPVSTPCGWTADVAEQFQNKYSQETDAAIRECRGKIVSMMYEVGLIGVRIGDGGMTQYCHTHQTVLPEAFLDTENVTVSVHPAFHKGLLIAS